MRLLGTLIGRNARCQFSTQTHYAIVARRCSLSIKCDTARTERMEAVERLLRADRLREFRRNAQLGGQASTVLSQVRNFLPRIAAANEQLQREIEQHGQASVDVETVADGGAFVEMNVALFPYDDDANAASEANGYSCQATDTDADDARRCPVVAAHAAARRPRAKRKRPLITVLSSTSSDQLQPAQRLKRSCDATDGLTASPAPNPLGSD